MAGEKNKKRIATLFHYHGYKKISIILKTFSFLYAFFRHDLWLSLISLSIERKFNRTFLTYEQSRLNTDAHTSLASGLGQMWANQCGEVGKSCIPRGQLSPCLEFVLPNLPCPLLPEATALAIEAATGSPQSQFLMYSTMRLPSCLPSFAFLRIIFLFLESDPIFRVMEQHTWIPMEGLGSVFLSVLTATTLDWVIWPASHLN